MEEKEKEKKKKSQKDLKFKEEETSFLDENIPSVPRLEDFLDASDLTIENLPVSVCETSGSLNPNTAGDSFNEEPRTFSSEDYTERKSVCDGPTGDDTKSTSDTTRSLVAGEDPTESTSDSLVACEDPTECTSDSLVACEHKVEVPVNTLDIDKSICDTPEEDAATFSAREEPGESYASLQQELHYMEPHFFLTKELERLKNLDLEDNFPEDYSEESLPDVYIEPSAPSFPESGLHYSEYTASHPHDFPVETFEGFPEASAPHFEDVGSISCRTGLTYESPSTTEYTADYENEGEAADSLYSPSHSEVVRIGEMLEQSTGMLEQPEMTPFTDSQLLTLYHNVELEKNYEFVNHWLDTQQDIEKFELDELLVNYQRVRVNLISTRKQLDRIAETVQHLQRGLWIISKEKVEEDGECEDGIQVTGVKERTIAEFCPETAKSLRNQFKQSRELLGENLSLFNFRAELCRLKIEDFIHAVLERSLNKTEGTGVFTPQEELRLTVSVLFKYLRKDLQDEKMARDLRIWLDRTIGVVLTQSTLYDHLFILNHIMRCPSGVGKWGACYVQPAIPKIDPEDPSFDNPYLDQLITILATILLPVKERSNFIQEFRLRAKNLKQVYESAAPVDSIWTVLDGEGSEDDDPEESWSELREADMIALLNQIPIDHMFRYVLRVEERDGKDCYDIGQSTQTSMLKLYAFATQFVYLLREGLKTFNTPKYRQFAKRLGRLIRQTVHFVSDHWQNFKTRPEAAPRSAMFQRLQLEYDYFFLRAAKCIFASLKLGIWQYLADIPYGTISSAMLWRIFYVLHLDYQEESHSDFGSEIQDWMTVLASPDLQIQFEEKCAEAEEAELFFLLSAFAKMAVSRSAAESAFIKRVVMDLFYIGFVSESTREASCKNCRDLLASVCTQHPFILSYIIQVLKLNVISLGKLSSYLVQELPWSILKPDSEDFQALFSWLRSSPGNVENMTARIILSNLNWDFGFLPVQHHISTAITVVEIFTKMSQDSVNQGIVNTSVNTMSNLAMATLSSLSFQEQQFSKWCWEMISHVRIHMMDRTPKEYDAILAGNPDTYKQILDFDLSPQIEPLITATVAKQPIACYCAVMLTQVGHSLPEILERGLGLIKIVLDSSRFDHVMELMVHILPIFLTDKSAIEHPDLSYIISRLVNADQTYLSLAKTIITGTFPGPVTKELGNMLDKIIENFDKLGQYSRKDILDLLIYVLIKVPSWNSNSSVLYLLDIVCSHAFGHSVCHWSVLRLFECMHETNNQHTSSAGIFSLFSRLGSHGHNLILSSSGFTQFPWLSFFVLQAEDNYMQKTGLWRILVAELSKEIPFEEALVEAGRLSEVNPPTSSQLIIYRWAQQAMDAPPNHPILFVFWQRFFSLYLSRPSELIEGQDGKGVGTKFFQGLINSMYFTKVKTSLKVIIEHYDKSIKDLENYDNSLNEELGKLFRTYYIWIDDAKLLDSALYIPALSPLYDPTRLVKILSGDNLIWMEYFNKDKVLHTCTEGLSDWDSLHFRQAHARKKSVSQSSLNEDNPEKRIIERLHSYDSRLPAPPLRRLAKPVPTFPNFTCKQSLSQSLSGPLDALKKFSESHCNNISAYGSLNCSYLEIITSLWKYEDVSVYVSAACAGTLVGKEKLACSGPALTNLIFSEAKRQEGIAVKLETNRRDLAEVDNQLLSPISPKYVIAAAVVNHTIQKILKLFERDLGKGVKSIHLPLANHIFCSLAKATTENWLSVAPLRHFISECLENLATIVVSQGECQAEVILDILKESPHLSSILTPHFFPKHQEILSIYCKIGELPIEDGSLSFVLLSKLDIVDWLEYTTTSTEVTKLLEIIFRNLEITGVKPDPERSMIHGLHRRHLSQILMFNFPTSFLEILSKVLILCGSNQIDPEVLIDILNSVIKSGSSISLSSNPDDVRDTLLNYAKTGQYDILTVLNIISKVSSHFEKDRLNFGLYGLYPKYRNYLKPISYLVSLLSLQLVHAQLSKQQGVLSPETTDFLWRNLKTLYDPWLSPISPMSRASTANWIQQLSDQVSSLMPWIPGDSALAKMVFDAMTHSMQIIIQNEEKSDILSNLLLMYSNYYAIADTKDHIFGVVHPSLSSLDWSLFVPSLKDIDAMMKIISMFLPQSHAFLGTIFVQVDWQTFIVERCHHAELVRRVLPVLFCLMIKLSSEPSVRQGGRLLSIVTQAESWDWNNLEYSHFESLAQWYVMSVDCRCIVKHKERSPLDSAIIRLFTAAAEFSGEERSVNREKKQMMWVKCCCKLLSSVCSKQKNFLSMNQPALHTTLRKLLEEMDIACTSTSAAPLMKDYLGIFNTTSSSVLPGSALVVTQSWFTQTDSHSLLIPAFLGNIGLNIRDAKLCSALLESGLETYFLQENTKPSWSAVKQILRWPSGLKIKELLEESVTAGHGLVLNAYIDLKQGECMNSQEEQALASTLLEYIRLLQTSTVPGLEAKLPLLYKKLVYMLIRTTEFTKEYPWVAKILSQFSDILLLIAESSTGWGRNILGAIGIGSQTTTSLRGKFLARALAVFIRCLLNPERTGLIEKQIDTADEGADEGSLKTATLCAPEMKAQLEKLRAFRSNKGFSGFQELVVWVLDQVEAESNKLGDTTLFIDYLVIDKLYTEPYLRTSQ